MSMPTDRFRAAILSLTLVACSPSAPEKPVDEQQISVEPRVEVGGCRAVQIGPTCVLPSPTEALRIWVEADPSAVVVVTVDGQPVRVQSTPVDAGRLLRLTALPEGERLSLTVSEGGRQGTWRLPLLPSYRFPPLRQARTLRAQGPSKRRSFCSRARLNICPMTCRGGC